MGFWGVADATTVTGDVSVAPFVGLETVSGKSFDPGGGGTWAGGAGSGLDVGDQVIGTGGVEGYPGCDGAAGDEVFLVEPHEEAAEIMIPRQIKACNRKIVALASERPLKTRVIRSHLSCVI